MMGPTSQRANEPTKNETPNLLTMDQHVWKNPINLGKLVPEAMRSKLLMEWLFSGASESALRTGLKMGPFHLDAGHSVFSKWSVLVISHGHADHTFSIASFFMTCGLGPHCKVYAPDVNRIEKIVQSILSCNYNTDAILKLPATFCEATVGLEDTIIIGKDKFILKTRALRHHVPSVGYFFYKTTSRLNPSLRAVKESMELGLGLDSYAKKHKKVSAAFGKILCTIRNGEPYTTDTDTIITSDNINVEFTLEQFCFLTDTNIKGISVNLDLIETFPIIIVECTFYDEDDLQHAIDKTHIHWLQLVPYVRMFAGSLWVLIHHSQRYKNLEAIKTAISTLKPPDNIIPSNCLIWAPSQDVHN